MIFAFILLAALLVVAPALGAITAGQGPTVTAWGLVTADRDGRITIHAATA